MTKNNEISSLLEKHGLLEFNKLATSTRTVMIYTNINFDRNKIFYNVNLTPIDIQLTQKQKNVDKKKINAPYGSIISVQSKTQIRGIDLRKKTKRWCTICRPIEVHEDKIKQIKTVTESLEKGKEKLDIYNIIYNCSNCQKSYRPEEVKKINHFLNQITIVLSIGKIPLLNIMLFKDSLKIAGCKDENDAAEGMLILWQDFISKIPDAWSLKKMTDPLKDHSIGGGNEPRFIFDIVMRNVDFKLGFVIDREKLNILMNQQKYIDIIYMSQYEPTNHTNVNIKMYSKQPINFKYYCLVIPTKKNSPFFITIDDNCYKKLKKKKRKNILHLSYLVPLKLFYQEDMIQQWKKCINFLFK